MQERELSPALRAEMAQTFRDPETGRLWLDRSIPAFSGRTPLDLIREGREDEVIALLQAFNLGLPS